MAFRTNPDGTKLYQDEEVASLQIFDPAMAPLDVEKHVDDMTALQLGVWYILSRVQVKSIDRMALVDRGVIETGSFIIDRVVFDWPDAEDTMAPDGSELKGPLVVIEPAGESSLNLAGPLSGQGILEETLDLYGAGTVLRKLFENRTELLAECIFDNKDDRAAARKAMISAFAGEPHEELAGRRVVIENYYDRLARYDLVGVSYEDTPETAQRKKYPMVLRILADIEVVDLVQAPEYMKPRAYVAEEELESDDADSSC